MLAMFRQALFQTNKNSAAPLVSERRFNQEAPKSNIPDDVNVFNFKKIHSGLVV